MRSINIVPGYPGHFNSLEDARVWTLDFVNWYNYQHRHSTIKFVTSEQKHDRGENLVYYPKGNKPMSRLEPNIQNAGEENRKMFISILSSKYPLKL